MKKLLTNSIPMSLVFLFSNFKLEAAPYSPRLGRAGRLSIKSFSKILELRKGGERHAIGWNLFSDKRFKLDFAPLSHKLCLLEGKAKIWRSLSLGFYIANDGQKVWITLPKLMGFQNTFHLTADTWELEIALKELGQDSLGLWGYKLASAVNNKFERLQNESSELGSIIADEGSQVTTATQTDNSQEDTAAPINEKAFSSLSLFDFLTDKELNKFAMQALETEAKQMLQAEECANFVQKTIEYSEKIFLETAETRLYIFGNEIFSKLKILINNLNYPGAYKNSEELNVMRISALGLLDLKILPRLVELSRSQQGIKFFNWLQESIDTLFQFKTLKAPCTNEEACENTYPQLKSTRLQKILDVFIAFFFDKSEENIIFENFKHLFQEGDESKKQDYFNCLHLNLLKSCGNLNQETLNLILSDFCPKLNRNLLQCQDYFLTYVDQSNTSYMLGSVRCRKAEFDKIKELTTPNSVSINGFALEASKDVLEITTNHPRKRLEQLQLALRTIERESEAIANELEGGKSQQALPENKKQNDLDSEKTLQKKS